MTNRAFKIIKMYKQIFNKTTGEAGFLAKGWSGIAMQWCSAVLILFPFLLPTSLPPPSSPSSLTWMRREQHEGEWKRGSSVLDWGSCAAPLPPPPFFLSSHLFFSHLCAFLSSNCQAVLCQSLLCMSFFDLICFIFLSLPPLWSPPLFPCCSPSFSFI